MEPEIENLALGHTAGFQAVYVYIISGQRPIKTQVYGKKKIDPFLLDYWAIVAAY